MAFAGYYLSVGLAVAIYTAWQMSLMSTTYREQGFSSRLERFVCRLFVLVLIVLFWPVAIVSLIW
jgi:hypothetical protein